MEQLPTPHNNFFHFALSHLPTARSLIETQLPATALRELNLDTLKIETGSFVDPNLREKYSDLLLSVELAGPVQDSPKEAFIYFLFEHKSDVEPMTVLQLLSYIVRIWEKRLRDGLPLCSIIPLVVYHGERGWTAARSMDELLRSPVGVAPYQVRFGFPLLDLSGLSNDQIGGEPILQSSLRLLKYSRSQQLPSMLRGILELLAKSGPAMGLGDWILSMGVYVMAVNPEIGIDELNQIIKSVFPTQIEPGSLADRLLAQGREEGHVEGLEEGLVEGREQGKLAGKIQMLQELLGDNVSTDGELLSRGTESLVAELTSLQARLRRREA